MVFTSFLFEVFPLYGLIITNKMIIFFIIAEGIK